MLEQSERAGRTGVGGSDRLSGDDYLDYWRRRMAKGPAQAGNEDQAQIIWPAIIAALADMMGLADKTPQTIVEFGCGYGRMTARIRAAWPAARLICLDISEDALKANKAANNVGDVRFILGHKLPARIRADLIFTCHVLQHVTDNDIFEIVCQQFARALRPGGRLVLFENTHQTNAPHMRDMGRDEWQATWPMLEWVHVEEILLPGAVESSKQPHCLMIGQKS